MKTIFTFLALFAVFLFAVAPEIFAADIIVKKVTIKKRVSKTANTDFKIEEMTMTIIPDGVGKGGNGNYYFFAFTVDAKKDAVINAVTLTLPNKDENGKESELTSQGFYNEKTGQYQVALRDKGFEFIADQAVLMVSNDQNDSFFFESVTKKKNNDSCDTKYKLKEINYETANANGLYTMQFSFNFEQNSDIPKTVEMIVQVTNCDGKTSNIKIKLSYDAGTGTYTGGQSFKQEKCKWALTYAEVYATNPCGTEDTWGSEFNQSKTNGQTTRDGANTVKTTKPALK